MKEAPKATLAIQEYYAILGIDANERDRAYPLNVRSVIAIFVFCSCVLSTSGYLLTEAGTIGEYIDSVSITSATIIDTFTYLSFFYRLGKFSTFVNTLEDTFQERQKFLATTEIYSGSSERLKKWNRVVEIVVVRLAPAFIVVPKFLGSVIISMTTDLGSDAFELVFPMWFPFDWKTPEGYVGAIAFQYVMAWYFVFLNACIVSFSFGSILALTSFTKDIGVNLQSINANVQDKATRSQTPDQIFAFIRFHASARQLGDDYSTMIQPSNMVFFTWCILQICAKMLMVQVVLVKCHSDFHIITETNDESSNVLQLIGPFSELLWSFGLVWIFCNLCESLSTAFDDVNDVVDQLDYYLFPNAIQKIFPFVIMNAQRPVVVECFGKIKCNLETFKRVVNGGFSYFIIFRRFY